DLISRIKIAKELTDAFIVNKGLRQGFCISPTLFKVYVVMALRNWKRKINDMGVEINDRCLITLQFADDRVIVACDREDMQYMVRKLMHEYQERVPDSTQDGNWEVDNGQEFLQCQKYEYLGSTFVNTGTDVKEIEKLIVKAKNLIGCLNGILGSKEFYGTKRRKFNIYEAMRLEGSHTDKRRKLRHLKWMPLEDPCESHRRGSIKNDHIKQQMGIEGTIVRNIEERQLTWYGHVERMPTNRAVFCMVQRLEGSHTDKRRKLRHLKWMPLEDPCESHRRGSIKNDHIKQQMGIEGTIVRNIEERQLTWYGHVERMPTN
ncbi:hypothetical protein HUJ04_011473, partial [Dendroctonus ponderosae]